MIKKNIPDYKSKVNLDLDKAEMTSAHQSIKCKNWNKVKLNSFKI